MSFLAIGTNYKYGPLELVEKLSFSPDVIYDALLYLKKEIF